jgi:tRNA(fMet)-specific endonuclease VapC
MIVLDSDHIRVLRRGGPQAEKLKSSLLAASDPDIVTTVVAVEESFRGWLAEVHRCAGDPDAAVRRKQVGYYQQFGNLIAYFAQWVVLPFDEAAFEEYERLRALRLRSIQTTDLKIAAMALSRGARLASGNLRHFELVPGLSVAGYR